MVFEFSGVPESEWAPLEAALKESSVPLSTKETLRVHPREGWILFEYEDGLSFYRATESETPVETFQSYLKNPVVARYMPATYEITGDDSVPEKVLNQFQNHYGRAADRIDWKTTEWKDRQILMVLIPQEIVTAMMRQEGGTLVSHVRGPASSLRQIPTMKPLIPDTVPDSEVVRRLFATQYAKNQYWEAMRFHSELLNEVVLSTATGISLGPVGTWYP